MDVIELKKDSSEIEKLFTSESKKYEYDFEDIVHLNDSGYKLPLYGVIHNDELGLYNIAIKLNVDHFMIDYDISFDEDIVREEIVNSAIDFGDTLDILENFWIEFDELPKFVKNNNLQVLWGDEKCDNNPLFFSYDPNVMYHVRQSLIDNEFYIGKVNDKIFILSRNLLNNPEIYNHLCLSTAEFINSVRKVNDEKIC